MSREQDSTCRLPVQHGSPLPWPPFTPTLLKHAHLNYCSRSCKLPALQSACVLYAARLTPCCEWDTAAADIIVREAGGIVLQAGDCKDDGTALQDWKVRSCDSTRVV